MLIELEFSLEIFNKLTYQIFMIIRPVEFELLPREQTDGRRDRYSNMTNLLVALRDFADGF